MSEIDKLILSLGSNDLEVQKNSSQALSKLGTKSVTPLISILLSDFTPFIVQTVTQLENGLIAEPPFTLLTEEAVAIRRNAAHVLAEINNFDAVEPLISTLQIRDPAIMQSVIYALSHFQDERAIEPLVSILSNATIMPTRLNVAVMEALVKIGKPAVLPLIEMLNNLENPSRLLAIGILGRIKDRRAIEPLIQSLQAIDKSIKLVAVLALREFNGEEVVNAIITALLDENNDDKFRKASISGLAHIGDKRALPALEKVAGENIELKEAAMEAIRLLKFQ